MSNTPHGHDPIDANPPSPEAARLSRRRALKAAAAAGVGVAAWATPSIKSVGGTPAYALACSQPGPFILKEDRGGNINCSTECAQAPGLSFGWLGAGNNSRRISGPGFTGRMTFVTSVTACASTALPVTLDVTRSDGRALDCTLTGIYVEAINGSKPVPANPPNVAPLIADGRPAPADFNTTDTDSDYVIPSASSPTGFIWTGVNKNGGIGNICSSQWQIEMTCTLRGC